jgi:uncharacterized protein
MFKEPVHVEGKLTKETGIARIYLTITAPVSTICARCAKPLSFTHESQFSADVTDDMQTMDIEAVVVDESGEIDIDEIVSICLVLHMDMVYYCKDDCKGLCPKCGKDLNEGPCGCKEDPDPRFSALRALLDKE